MAVFGGSIGSPSSATVLSEFPPSSFKRGEEKLFSSSLFPSSLFKQISDVCCSFPASDCPINSVFDTTPFASFGNFVPSFSFNFSTNAKNRLRWYGNTIPTSSRTVSSILQQLLREIKPFVTSLSAYLSSLTSEDSHSLTAKISSLSAAISS